MTTDGPSRSNEELLRVARADPAAFEELYRRCVQKTVRFAVRRCGTAEQVHDLVAATWLEVIDASTRFDPSRGDALPWILEVMANLANDQARRRAREHEALRRLAGQRVLEPDDIARLEEAIDATRLADHLAHALEEVPPREREAFEIVAFGRVSQEEAASALGIESATYRMRLARARQKLRAALARAESTDVEVVR